MKIPVKVKATGDIVDVDISVATAGNPLYTTFGGVTYLGDELEPAEPDWQQVRIDAAIAAMQGLVSSHEARITAKSMADKTNSTPSNIIAMCAVSMADELIKELKSNVDAYAEGRRQTAINTASVCENMTKIQKELQKKGGDNEDP